MSQESQRSSTWVPCPWQRSGIHWTPSFTILRLYIRIIFTNREFWADISTWAKVCTDFKPVCNPLSTPTFKGIATHSKCNTTCIKVITITHLIPPPTLSSLPNWNLANRILKKPSCSFWKNWDVIQAVEYLVFTVIYYYFRK